MKIEDLPDTATVHCCTHVLNGERPIKYVCFSNGVIVSCSEPDHGLFGEKHRTRTTLGGLKKVAPLLADFDLSVGQAKELQASGEWKVVPINRGPRELDWDEYQAYRTDKVQGT